MTTTYPPFDTDHQRQRRRGCAGDDGDLSDELIARPPLEPSPRSPAPRAAARRRRTLRSALLFAGVIAVAGSGLLLRGSGLKTRILVNTIPGYRERLAVPEVIAATPPDGATRQELQPTFAATIKIPNGKLKADTVNDRTVWLIRTADQTPTPIDLKLAGGGGRIEVRPKQPLREKTQYALGYTNGVTDEFDRPLKPYGVTFTTAGTSDPSVHFEKVALPAARNAGFTCVVMGPDHHLWAASDDGRIFRFSLAPDGSLGTPTIIDSLVRAQGAARILVGFCFDPQSTADNPVLWASHGFCSFNHPPDFSGKISRLSGPDLSVCEDVVVNLPRSVRDHMNNQPSFGPDGALYWPQPSNTAYGDADPIWGMRPEHLLNASVLRLDVSKWTPGDKPIDVKTMDAGGTYDPSAKDAPVTIYASGVRLAYDLLWHSNGHLYAPVNGSAAGGNTPAGNGNGIALKNIPVDEDDWLFRVERGRYYGHPNPAAGHYVLNGGNPTGGYDYAELPLYPVGTRPDPNWQRAVYDFGRHASADGAIEYRDVAFGGKLDKSIMVCRYNFGSDVIVLHLDDAGNVTSDDVCVRGLQNLETPLDLAEDTATGNLYVSEYAKQCLTLLRAIPAK